MDEMDELAVKHRAFPQQICNLWCWYIYLHDWVILFGQMLVNIPYMEHLGRGKLPKGESCFGFLLQGV